MTFFENYLYWAEHKEECLQRDDIGKLVERIHIELQALHDKETEKEYWFLLRLSVVGLGSGEAGYLLRMMLTELRGSYQAFCTYYWPHTAEYKIIQKILSLGSPDYSMEVTQEGTLSIPMRIKK